MFKLLLSESSEEIQDFLQRKNKYICPQEALTYGFPFWIVKSYRKSVSNVCIYRLSPSSRTNTAKCKQTFVKDIFIGIEITHEAFRTRNGKDNSHFYTKRFVFLALRRK